jgi:hypothetical protein
MHSGLAFPIYGYFVSVILTQLKRSQLYSEELSIALDKNIYGEQFKWFLASLLFGARITETIASNTSHAFYRHGLLTRRKTVVAGWGYWSFRPCVSAAVCATMAG